MKNPPPGLTNVIAIAAGCSNSLALKADGSVVVWGFNQYGPVYRPPGLTNVVAVSGGFIESLVLRPDGTLLSWGREPGLSVVQSNVVVGSQSISAGMTHSIALKDSGTVFAWGDNSFGQCDVPPDTHTITATGTDSNGKVTVSDPITFSVDAPPAVTVTSPTANAVFSAPASITLSATASDSDGNVTKVEFYANQTLVATDTTAPYSFVWNNVPAGNYTITAKATDNDGALTTSLGVPITVQ